MPATYQLDLYRGDTAVRTFVLWQDAEKTQPADLTGAVARAQIRREPRADALLIELACTVTVPNTIAVEIAASSWPDDAAFCEGAWDLELTYPGDVVQTVVAGPVRVIGDVTRP